MFMKHYMSMVMFKQLKLALDAFFPTPAACKCFSMRIVAGAWRL